MAHYFVGMSGGVDSSAAAFKLLSEGHRVTGVTFTAAQEEGSKKCCSLEEIQAARHVAEFLGIPHRTLDLRDVFETRVVRPFIDAYTRGLTPNPCVACNRFVKFGAMLDFAISEGADGLATGHYARVSETPDGFGLFRGADLSKDQSYFLSFIEPERLSLIHLPLGGMTKPEVRALVESSGMPISSRKAESQDICFVKDDYRDFLALRGVKERPGEFYYHGTAVGRHRGIPFYSLGQRRGLGIALGERIFVRELQPEEQRIVLGEKPVSVRFTVEPYQRMAPGFTGGRAEVQTRYQSRLSGCTVLEISPSEVRVELDQPQEIVAPGQYAVFYIGDRVVASGMIRSVELTDVEKPQ